MLTEILEETVIIEKLIGRETKDNKDKIKEATALIRAHISKLLIEFGRLSANANLGTEIKEQLSTIEDKMAQEATRPSFAQVTQTRVQVNGKKVQPSKSVKIIIEPVDGNKNVATSDDTKREVMTIVKPRETGLKVDRIIRTRNRGIIIETDSKNYKAITENGSLRRIGLTTKKQDKMRPRVAVYGLPRGLTKEDVKDALFKQNLQNAGLESEITPDELEPVFQFGNRDQPTVHWVIEVTSRVRKTLVNWSKVYIDFQRYTITDYVKIKRCFKCQGFGHIGKDCQRKETCSRCAGEHEFKRCTVTDKNDFKCANCTFAKLGENQAKHEATDTKCTMYQKRLDSYLQNVDYA